MIQFIQPVLSLLIGLALSLYGLIHSSSHYPGHHNLYMLWQSLPALSSVFVFLLGLIAVIGGLGLVLTASQGLRRRYRQIDRTYGDPRNSRHNHYEDDDGYGAGVYR